MVRYKVKKTALHHRWLGERRAMETVLCNNNWMAVSFHLLVSPSTWRSAKRRTEEGAMNERLCNYGEMIVARKEEEWNFGKKSSSSSLFLESDLSRLTVPLPSSINPWKIFTINDTASKRLSSNSRPVCGIFVASKSCDFIFSILYSWQFSAEKSVLDKSKKAMARWDSTYNKQTPFDHNRRVTILPRSAANDLILVKQSGKSIYDTFLKTVSPFGKRKTNHRSKMVHATYNGQTFSDIDSISISPTINPLLSISLSSMYLYFS